MAKQSLLSMSVDALLKLRDDIGDVLSEKAGDLRRQLQALGGSDRPAPRSGGKGPSKLKGTKARAKYRDPETGETWSGRGGTARWLVAYEKQGRKRDEFLISGSVAKKKAGKRK